MYSHVEQIIRFPVAFSRHGILKGFGFRDWAAAAIRLQTGIDGRVFLMTHITARWSYYPHICLRRGALLIGCR